MLRRSGQCCDLDHLAAAARTYVEGPPGEQSVALAVIDWRRSGGGLRNVQCRANSGELGAAMGVGQEPEVTNAAKAIGQHMQQEAADELTRVERHHLGFVAGAVVFPAETNPPVVTIDKPAVGDGNAMGVAAEIVEDLLRPAEGTLGVDHPLDLSQRLQRCGESRWFGEAGDVAEEVQRSSVESGLQALQE